MVQSKVYSVMALLAVLAACQGTSETVSPVAYEQSCADPRPQICTMDYRPVCGFKPDGTASTYPNGCGACADEKVSGYSEGECKK